MGVTFGIVCLRGREDRPGAVGGFDLELLDLPGAKGCSPRKHSLGGGEAVLGVRDDLDDGKDKLSTL